LAASQDKFYELPARDRDRHLGSVFYLQDRLRAEVDHMVAGVSEGMPHDRWRA